MRPMPLSFRSSAVAATAVVVSASLLSRGGPIPIPEDSRFGFIGCVHEITLGSGYIGIGYIGIGYIGFSAITSIFASYFGPKKKFI